MAHQMRPRDEHKPARDRESQRLDKIFVRDLVLPCFVGAFEEEKGKTQRVRFCVDLWLLAAKQRSNDDVSRVVSYDRIVEAIHTVTGNGHINLVETMAERIATKCLAHRRAARVRVVVEKLDRLASGTLGVEIERCKFASN